MSYQKPLNICRDIFNWHKFASLYEQHNSIQTRSLDIFKYPFKGFWKVINFLNCNFQAGKSSVLGISHSWKMVYQKCRLLLLSSSEEGTPSCKTTPLLCLSLARNRYFWWFLLEATFGNIITMQEHTEIEKTNSSWRNRCFNNCYCHMVIKQSCC